MTLTDRPGETLLLRQPAISAERLAFVYAGDLWLASLEGERPLRITAQQGRKLSPMFSPDGRWIAFSGDYDGSLSVYVVATEGGAPRRLTYHPGEDFVRGWTPDGQVLFASARASMSPRVRQLYSIPPDGGHPTALPMPTADRASFSPDGHRIAYTPYIEAFWSWKRYRGGGTVPIWLLDLRTLEHTEIPHENASDSFPCWVEDAIFFLSDRHGTMNVFRYDLGGGAVTQQTFHEDFDVRWLSAGPGRLAYEQGGRLHLLTPATGESRALAITVAADLPATRPRYQRAAPHIQKAGVSPTGKRAVFEARGEILTVPVGKGDMRNLTQTPGVCERDPAWSPDGRWIAYFSDESGEYELVIADQKGARQRSYPLGAPSFYHAPVWSPDGLRIAYTDKALNLFYLTLESGAIVHVTTDTYDHPFRSLDPAWSPDSAWLAYTRRLPSHLRAVFLYELASGQTHQLSDGMSDTISACFSRDGKHLFFAASVNFGLNTGWLDMSSFERPVTRSLYVAVLSSEDPSPLAPESDEELEAAGQPAQPGSTEGAAATAGAPPTAQPGSTEGAAATAGAPSTAMPPAGGGAGPAPVRIDFAGLDQRILALPVPPGDYFRLQAAEGKLFYLQSTPERRIDPESLPGSNRLCALLNRPLLCYWATREGRPFSTPNASIPGPKVMLINELAGSGGDALPLFFRRRGLGKLVGKRTWGGLIGIYDYPTLIDGGFFTSPRLAIYSPDGAWEVENEGVAPDIEVEMTPRLVMGGRDPQLEKAVELVLAELEQAPRQPAARPAPARRAEMRARPPERE